LHARAALICLASFRPSRARAATQALHLAVRYVDEFLSRRGAYK
jgi:hypothetical protein